MPETSPVLIETVRVRNGTTPLWPLHLARLWRSCSVLGLSIPTLVVPGRGEDRAVRLELSHRGPSWGSRPLGSIEPVKLVTSRIRHSPYRDKTTDRAQFDAALAEAQAVGADDGLMLTDEGLVAECAVWTLFWWEGSRVCTPALSLGVLPSVSRMRIADLVGGVTERQLRREQLPTAGVFVANAVRGIVSVASMDGVACPEAPATVDLRARFWP
ncbi:MAG TPA: aminotransferase class IV [Gemmatimonadales bacterium]|nr:aminotransferase class IV [Gemmatimonadales bacterium]